MAAEALPPVNYKAIYRFSGAGIEFGRIGMEVQENGKTVSATADIMTSGLMRMLVKHSSHSTLNMTNGSGVYESNYKTRKKARYVKMVVKNGVIVEETRVPSDPPDKRPPVPDELKKNAHTPLGFMLAMREATFNALQSGTPEYTLYFYDGRRLTQADFVLKGRQTFTLDGKKTPAIVVVGKRKPLAGFSKSELDKADPNEPSLTIYYSDDGRFIPLHMQAPLMIGTLAATLTKECAEGESCLLGNKE